MKVILELVSEPGSGQQWPLQKDQVLTFGRTEWADVSFQNDPMMSGQHFSVENNGQFCWVKDLKSTNGTRLNGEFIEKSVVQNGDTIQAGKTKVSVTIVGGAAVPMPSIERDWQGTQFGDASSGLGQNFPQQNLVDPIDPTSPVNPAEPISPPGSPPPIAPMLGSPAPSSVPDPTAPPMGLLGQGNQPPGPTALPPGGPTALPPGGPTALPPGGPTGLPPGGPTGLPPGGPTGLPPGGPSGMQPSDLPNIGAPLGAVPPNADAGNPNLLPGMPPMTESPIDIPESSNTPTGMNPNLLPEIPVSENAGADQALPTSGPINPNLIGFDDPILDQTSFDGDSVGGGPIAGGFSVSDDLPAAGPSSPIVGEESPVVGQGANPNLVGMDSSFGGFDSPVDLGGFESPVDLGSSENDLSGNLSEPALAGIGAPLSQPQYSPPPSHEPIVAAVPHAPSPLLFIAEEVESGLHLYRSAYDVPDEHFLPAQLLTKLSQDSKLVVIIHYQKMEQETPADIQQCRPLFDWLPEEVARKFGPIVLLPSDVPDFDETANESWDRDAMLCFLTKKEPEAVIEHLAKAIHFNNNGEETAGADSEMFGYCWPSVLSQLLTFRDNQFVNNLLGPDIDAVLMELPDLPNSWQLLTKEDWSAKLIKCGVKQGPVTE